MDKKLVSKLEVGKVYVVKDYSTYVKDKREIKILRVSSKSIKAIDQTNPNNLIYRIYEIDEFFDIYDIIDEYYEGSVLNDSNSFMNGKIIINECEIGRLSTSTSDSLIDKNYTLTVAN